jgi:hypothetical protein
MQRATRFPLSPCGRGRSETEGEGYGSTNSTVSCKPTHPSSFVKTASRCATFSLKGRRELLWAKLRRGWRRSFRFREVERSEGLRGRKARNSVGSCGSVGDAKLPRPRIRGDSVRHAPHPPHQSQRHDQDPFRDEQEHNWHNRNVLSRVPNNVCNFFLSPLPLVIPAKAGTHLWSARHGFPSSRE